MSAISRGRRRADKPRGLLRRPGDFREPEIENIYQNDEKPLVLKFARLNKTKNLSTFPASTSLIYT